MYRQFRAAYHFVDKLLLSRMSVRRQLALKGRVLKWARAMFPARSLVQHPGQLIERHGTDGMGPSWRSPALPAWVKKEMLALADIDPSLHPDGPLLGHVSFYSAAWCYDEPGQIYTELRNAIQSPVDIVIAVPWLKTGGADLGALHVANTLADDLGQRVLVLATEDAASPWAGRLSPRVQFLSVGGRLNGIAAGHQIDVLVRLLLQVRPSVFHVMNSRLAWDAVARNGLALRQHMKLYASLYCDDFDESGMPVGYARAYLPRCHPMLEAVVTDNQRTWRTWVAEMAVPESLFRVLPYPAPHSVHEGGIAGSAQGKALLWAGRLDRQKRPDVLARIAQALPSYRFDVYGASVWQPADIADLRNLPNVCLHGHYEHFDDLVRPDHVAFIYTSEWDGMPNILMEAAAAGLPVIAPNVGGIPDFIDESALVESCEDAAGYVAAIHRLVANPSLRESAVAAMRQNITRTRRREAFVARLSELMDLATKADENGDGPTTDGGVAGTEGDVPVSG